MVTVNPSARVAAARAIAGKLKSAQRELKDAKDESKRLKTQLKAAKKKVKRARKLVGAIEEEQARLVAAARRARARKPNSTAQQKREKPATQSKVVADKSRAASKTDAATSRKKPYGTEIASSPERTRPIRTRKKRQLPIEETPQPPSTDAPVSNTEEQASPGSGDTAK
jgi:hypothetical protein